MLADNLRKQINFTDIEEEELENDITAATSGNAKFSYQYMTRSIFNENQRNQCQEQTENDYLQTQFYEMSVEDLLKNTTPYKNYDQPPQTSSQRKQGEPTDSSTTSLNNIIANSSTLTMPSNFSELQSPAVNVSGKNDI